MKQKQPPKKCDRCGENPARVKRGTEQVRYTCSREIDQEIAEYREAPESVQRNWMQLFNRSKP